MLTRSYQTFPCPPKCKQWGFFLNNALQRWVMWISSFAQHTCKDRSPRVDAQHSRQQNELPHAGQDAPELPTAQRSTCAYLAGLHSLHWAHSLPFPQNYKLPWEELSCSSQGTWWLCKLWPPDFAPWRGNPIPDFLLGIISILLPELPGPAWPVSL